MCVCVGESLVVSFRFEAREWSDQGMMMTMEQLEGASSVGFNSVRGGSRGRVRASPKSGCRGCVWAPRQCRCLAPRLSRIRKKKRQKSWRGRVGNGVARCRSREATTGPAVAATGCLLLHIFQGTTGEDRVGRIRAKPRQVKSPTTSRQMRHCPESAPRHVIRGPMSTSTSTSNHFHPSHSSQARALAQHRTHQTQA